MSPGTERILWVVVGYGHEPGEHRSSKDSMV
jgi:hypothetical protein